MGPGLVRRATLAAAWLCVSAGVAACGGGPRPSSLSGTRLATCPAAPHCVNSQDPDARHAIRPFAVRGELAEAWPGVIAAVEGLERTTIVEKYDYYLHATVISPWHFYTDDLELYGDRKARVLHVRSASRIGYYDFGVNRDRVEALRRKLVELGLIDA